MSGRLVKTAYLGVVLLALVAFSHAALAQDGAELVKQLSGQTQAPTRDAAQLAQAYQTAIDYLLPLMSAENVGSRYNYQIMLQDMGSHASRPGAETERLALAKVMLKTIEQAEMPGTVRNWFVRQIERMGKGESVPTLVKLMASEDKNLRDYARQALEKNPDPSATDALLKGLSAAKGAGWKIGLMNSLGARQAQAAVSPIAQALNDEDVTVAKAAVTALSQIGGRESIRALLGVLDKPDVPVEAKAAQGLVDIAQAMARADDTAGAARVYGALYDWATKTSGSGTVNIRAAAVNGLVVCDPERGAREVVTLIQDSNPRIRTAAVEAARQAPSKTPAQALMRMLPRLTPESQAQVLGLVSDRGDASSIGVAQGFLTSEDESVRLAAVDALSKIGTEASAKALMEVAVKGDSSMRKAATAGLAAMPGADVERFIDTKAASGDVKVRVVAIGLLGQRHASGAPAKLLRYAAEGNDDISAASFDAMAPVAASVDAAALADLVAKTKTGTVRAEGVAALKAVLAKAQDKDAAARTITGRMKTADADGRIALLTSLSALGGATAMNAVIEATNSSDEALCDAAIRTLCNWPDYEAAAVLLDIAAQPQTSLTHYALATRGALRLISASDWVSTDERMALCLRALDQARRDDERRQAVSTLGSLPSQEAADRLLELAKDENLKTEAGLAAIECATGMLRIDRQAARDLAQKIRDMNISDAVNERADAVISGRGMRGFRGFGGFRNLRGSRRQR